MPTGENFKQLLKIKEKMIKLHVPSGVNLNKLKEMTITPLVSAIAPKDRSNFLMISIAGETIALGKTGLISSEKALGDKGEFERLYVHPDLKADQANLEELMKRMFQITAIFTRKPILPPKDPKEYTLLMKSLKYRLGLLQKELEEMENESTLQARQTLDHFYRLRDLIASLEGSWKKKKVQTYVAVVSTSGAPPLQEEKLSIDEEEAARLLQLFGLVLLQSQHQLPGFSFPFSPNELVAKLRSLDLDAVSFEETLQEENKEIQPAIEDVLHPDEKAKQTEARFVEMGQILLQTMVDHLPDEDAKEEFQELLDPQNPPATLEDFLQGLLSITEEIAETRFMLAERIRPLRSRMQELQTHLDDVEEKFQATQEKIQKLQSDRDADIEQSSESTEKLMKEIEDLEEELHNLEAERDACVKDKQGLQAEIVRLQTEEVQKKQLEQATTSLRQEVETYKKQAEEKVALTKQLEAKDQELETLRKKQRSIEDLEIVTRTQREEIKKLQALRTQLSKERMALETRLGSYKGLEKLVSSIPLNATAPPTNEFQAFSARIRKLLDEREAPRDRPEEGKEGEEGKDMEGGGLEAPLELDVPTVLELKARMVQNVCEVLETLEDLHKRYLEEEPSLQEQLQDLSSLDVSPAELAEALQTALIYSVTEQEKSALQPYEALYKKLPTVISSSEEFKDAFLATGVDTDAMDEKLSAAGLPSYAVLFYLYLEALARWINCAENISKPLECPQIPPILKREQLQCKPQTSP